MAVLDMQRTGQQIGRIRHRRAGQGHPTARGARRSRRSGSPGVDGSPQRRRRDVRRRRPRRGSAAEWEVITGKSRDRRHVRPAIRSYPSRYEMWNKGGCLRRCDSQREQISNGPCLCPHAEDTDQRGRGRARGAKRRADMAKTNPPQACKLVTRDQPHDPRPARHRRIQAGHAGPTMRPARSATPRSHGGRAGRGRVPARACCGSTSGSVSRTGRPPATRCPCWKCWPRSGRSHRARLRQAGSPPAAARARRAAEGHRRTRRAPARRMPDPGNGEGNDLRPGRGTRQNPSPMTSSRPPLTGSLMRPAPRPPTASSRRSPRKRKRSAMTHGYASTPAPTSGSS